MIQIKYGSFCTEQDIRHLWISKSVGGGCFTGSFIHYPHCYHFSDIVFHRFTDEANGSKCEYSPTGFCSMYDSVRWDSVDMSFSESIAKQILVERINQALEREGFELLTSQDLAAIDKAMRSPQLWNVEE